MKRMKINYIPALIVGISVVLFITITLVCMGIWGEVGKLIGFVSGGAVTIWLLTRGTIVEFGKGTVIRCRYVFYMWKIDLEKIDRFSYSIDEYATRGGQRNTFTLRFYYSINGCEDDYVLRKMIDKSDIKRLMSGDAAKLELMEIYRYAESVFPEKAKGYVEDSGFFE